MVADANRLASRLRHRVARDPLLRELRDLSAAATAELWLVGGYVRDAALGLRSHDVDLVAGRGCARLVRSLRSRWRTSGYRFRKRGVTTWRFRRGERLVDLVDASRRGLEADLRRRELTLNAVAFALEEGRVVDPLGGCADLRARRLRAPRPGVFGEDPLRALRLCRFVAQFPEFRAGAGARQEAAAVARRLRRAPVERVRQELDKLLLGHDPRRGLRLLDRLGLRSAVLPELDGLEDCVAGPGRPDVWSHTLDAIALGCGGRLPGYAELRTDDDRLVLRWALLLHDISKPETFARAADGRPTFHGHESLGARRADALLQRMRAPTRVRRRVVRLVRLHLRPSQLADAGATPRGLRRLNRAAGEDLALLALHAACDARASETPDAARRWRRLRRVLGSLLATHRESRDRPPPRLIDGRDVMRVLDLPPGPRVGRALDRVRGRQLDGAIRTRAEALAYLRTLRRG